MIIHTKIDFKSYLKWNFYYWLRRGGVILLAYLLIVISVGMLRDNHTIRPFLLGFLIVIVLYLPFRIYFSTKRFYNSNKRIQENITYEFLEGGKMKINGSSFSSESDLNSLYRIVEWNNWFVLFSSRRIANIIPKGNLTQNEIEELRSYFNNIKTIPVKLQKSF